MGYEELFPPNDLKGWHANAAKRFASPFVDNYHDRVDVDPIMLSNAASASSNLSSSIRQTTILCQLFLSIRFCWIEAR
jgi:hypothetical protein